MLRLSPARRATDHSRAIYGWGTGARNRTSPARDEGTPVPGNSGTEPLFYSASLRLRARPDSFYGLTTGYRLRTTDNRWLPSRSVPAMMLADAAFAGEASSRGTLEPADSSCARPAGVLPPPRGTWSSYRRAPSSSRTVCSMSRSCASCAKGTTRLCRNSSPIRTWAEPLRWRKRTRREAATPRKSCEPLIVNLKADPRSLPRSPLAKSTTGEIDFSEPHGIRCNRCHPAPHRCCRGEGTNPGRHNERWRDHRPSNRL